MMKPLHWINYMLKPIDIIKGLADAEGNRLQVKKVIRLAWDDDCEDFFVGLDLATNPAYAFNLTTVPAIDDEDDGDPGTLTFAHFNKVALNIAYGELTDVQINKVLEDCALSANVTEWNLWYRRILLKTLPNSLPMDAIREALLSLTTDSSVLPNND